MTKAPTCVAVKSQCHLRVTDITPSRRRAHSWQGPAASSCEADTQIPKSAPRTTVPRAQVSRCTGGSAVDGGGGRGWGRASLSCSLAPGHRASELS